MVIESSGEALRRARLGARISLDVMAERTRYSKAHLGNVETGKRAATEDVVEAYNRVLFSWAPPPELFERIPTGDAAKRRPSRTLMLNAASALSDIRRADDQAKGIDHWTQVAGQLDRIATQIPQVSHPDGALLLAAEHAHWLSWVAFHKGQRSAAMSWLDLAARWAQDCGSVDMMAFVARVRSFYYLRDGDHYRAATVARTASYGGLSPATRSIVSHAQSLAAAASGKRDNALRLADAAYTDALQARDVDSRPPWLYWLDETRAVLNRGDVALRVGDFSEAVDLISTALDRLTDFPRDRIVYMERLNDARQRTFRAYMLQLDFKDLPAEKIREDLPDYGAVRRSALAHLHRVLEETAERSPDEALELNKDLPYADPTESGPWSWEYGRARVRLSREA